AESLLPPPDGALVICLHARLLGTRGPPAAMVARGPVAAAAGALARRRARRAARRVGSTARDGIRARGADPRRGAGTPATVLRPDLQQRDAVRLRSTLRRRGPPRARPAARRSPRRADPHAVGRAGAGPALHLRRRPARGRDGGAGGTRAGVRVDGGAVGAAGALSHAAPARALGRARDPALRSHGREPRLHRHGEGRPATCGAGGDATRARLTLRS